MPHHCCFIRISTNWSSNFDRHSARAFTLLRCHQRSINLRPSFISPFNGLYASSEIKIDLQKGSCNETSATLQRTRLHTQKLCRFLSPSRQKLLVCPRIPCRLGRCSRSVDLYTVIQYRRYAETDLTEDTETVLYM